MMMLVPFPLLYHTHDTESGNDCSLHGEASKMEQTQDRKMMNCDDERNTKAWFISLKRLVETRLSILLGSGWFQRRSHRGG
jgi:hypothetical protein